MPGCTIYTYSACCSHSSYWFSLGFSLIHNSPAVVDPCEDVYLVQHVQNATRCRGNQQPSLLDLVFTSSISGAIDSIAHLAPLGSSDHDLLLHMLVPRASTTYEWNYSRGNYVEFSLQLFLPVRLVSDI